MLVNHEYVNDSFDIPGNTNIAVAGMVTSYARIHLYNIIDQIESSTPGRTLYFDTDSVIFVHKSSSNWHVPVLGDFLGDMTDEVIKDYGPVSYIDKFASGGPKNYSYTVQAPEGEKLITKIKGINITNGIKNELDFPEIQKFAKSYKNGINLTKNVKQLQFKADIYHNVTTRVFNKTYRVVSDKRIVTKEGNYQTLPFGYQM